MKTELKAFVSDIWNIHNNKQHKLKSPGCPLIYVSSQEILKAYLSGYNKMNKYYAINQAIHLMWLVSHDVTEDIWPNYLCETT